MLDIPELGKNVGWFILEMRTELLKAKKNGFSYFETIIWDLLEGKSKWEDVVKAYEKINRENLDGSAVRVYDTFTRYRNGVKQ